MGIALGLVSHNDSFYRRAKRTPLIVNDLKETSEEDKEALNKMIYTKYSSDLLSNLPTCECGDDQGIVGEYNIGVVCPICNTAVKSQVDQELEPLVWIRAPKGVRALINPNVWIMLTEKFTKSNFDIIRWICDTGYKPSERTPPVMEEILALGIQRGYNNFVDNFDKIMDSLFSLRDFRPKKDQKESLHHLLKTQRDCIFSTYLPLPNRAMLVIEETNVGTYVDPIVTGAIDAIRTMVSIDSDLSNHSVRVKENRTIKTIAQLAEFYDGLYKTTLARKEGTFRKHIFGTRSHFSFRAVISSLTDNHHYDELHIPWGIGASVFGIHLQNKLMRLGYSPNEAKAFLYEHSQKYHPLLEELFEQLIAEAPKRYDPQGNELSGISCILQRNPSLERGSAQAMFITKIKRDVLIPTISMSILAVSSLNADFDGDQLNVTLSLDNEVALALRALAPHMSVFDLNAPRKVSRSLAMPKPVISTIANWLHSDDPAIV